MSIPRRAFADAVPIALADLPRLGIEPWVVAAIALDFGEDDAGNIIGGITPDPMFLPSPRPGAAFRYDWSDADERDPASRCR